MSETNVAKALISVLEGSRWIGVNLARAFLDHLDGVEHEDIARNLYNSGCLTLTKAREMIPIIKDSGFLQFIPTRKKLGSAENPITKLFPAAITEQRFLIEIDTLRGHRATVDYVDDRFSGHTLVDFTLTEGELELPINVKNAGTRFENAKQLVGLEPDDCIPIPVYKAYDALEKEPNLLYAISIDYLLIDTINTSLIPFFDKAEQITWDVLNSHSGTRIRDAEDKFVYSMTLKYWDKLFPNIKNNSFCLISARKAIRILQKHPKRTPGIGLRAWGTGANAEVNVHISLAEETKSWNEIFKRICNSGIEDIVKAINRKRTEVVYDPEI
jgi:hypothetical protein